jgi:hypothetical protein
MGKILSSISIKNDGNSIDYFLLNNDYSYEYFRGNAVNGKISFRPKATSAPNKNDRFFITAKAKTGEKQYFFAQSDIGLSLAEKIICMLRGNCYICGIEYHCFFRESTSSEYWRNRSTSFVNGWVSQHAVIIAGGLGKWSTENVAGT